MVDERAAGAAVSDRFLDVRLGGEADDAEEEDQGRDGTWGGAEVVEDMDSGFRGRICWMIDRRYVICTRFLILGLGD